MIERRWAAFVVACLVVAVAAFGAGAGTVALFSDSETVSGSFSVSEDADGVGSLGWNESETGNESDAGNESASERRTAPENGTVPGTGADGENGTGNGSDGANDSGNGTGVPADGGNASTGNASVEVRGVTLSDDAVPVGDEAAVRVAVENVGSDTATFAATLTVDGTPSTNETVEVAPGANATLSLRHAFDAPGNYSLAAAGRTAGEVTAYEPTPDLTVTDATVDATTVEPNESVTATASVVNGGTASGTLALDLVVDGTVVDGRNVTVAAGETTTVAFQHAVSSPGSYDLAIGGVSAGTVEVVEPEEGTSDDGRSER